MADKRSARIKQARVLKKFGFSLLVGAACAAIVFLLGRSDFIKRTELITLDLRYRNRPPIAFRPDVGYIDFDDSSIELFGNYSPWPRHRQVTLIKTLDFYDAKAAGYDIFFVEPNDIIYNPHAPVTEAFRDIDAEFTDALQNAGIIFLAEVMVRPDIAVAAGGLTAILGQTRELSAAMPPSKKEAMEIAARYAAPIDSAVENALWKAVDITTVIPTLANAARGLGYAQIVKDLDPTVRLYPLFMYYDGKAHSSIAVTMLSYLLEVPVERIKIIPGEHVEFPDALVAPERRETIRIPIDDHGQMLVNWAGKFMDRGLHVSFRHISAFFALNKAKEIARNYAPDPALHQALIAEIRKSIDEEGLVSADESDAIARQIALAHIAEVQLREGRSTREILATVDEDPIFGEKVISAVAHALGHPSTLEEAWKQEIDKNLLFFRNRERLADVEPLFFPKAITAPWDGISKTFSPTDLENKIFMIGLTGLGTIDINPMPYEKACPMVALHTHTINTILTRQFLYFPDASSRVLFIILLALLAAVICAFLPPLRAFLACALVGSGYSLYIYQSWVNDGRWIPWVEPLLSLSTTYIAMVVIEFIKAAQEKRLVRGLFSTMVSPNVLKLMEQNPDKFSLTGERKEATIFFSSIDGFNKVTQGVEPDELTSILSLYLTPASDIILAYDGYIDKYEGHIIMADFGVPLDDPDHAWKCCFAAIEQQLDIEAFKVFVAARYGEDVSVSMGINSGFVSAGNMGSEKKMQYTVMGDAVNVAARFRPANGIYNTGIITGEAAEPLIRDHVELRTLDKILLKGKTTPVTIYEIMGWKRDAYFASVTGKPLSKTRAARWSKCPPEKVFGYARFWRKCEAEFHEHSEDAAFAGEIASFFEGQFEQAERIMVSGAIVAMDELRQNVERLENILRRIDDSFASLIQAPKETWQENVLQWKNRVNFLVRGIEKASADNRKVPPELPSLLDLRLQAESLEAKYAKLSISLGKTSKVGIDAVNHALAAIRNWFLGKDVPPDALAAAEASRNEYRAAVDAFFSKLIERSEDYFKLLARVGSLSSRRMKVRELFEDALRLHWERNWDGALARLHEAKTLDPVDGPVNAFLDRINFYKDSPPPATWQGEFVQTKK